MTKTRQDNNKTLQYKNKARPEQYKTMTITRTRQDQDNNKTRQYKDKTTSRQ